MIKMQARGVLTLTKKLRARMNFDTGSIVQAEEKNGGIFIAPASHFDASLQEDVRSALKDFKTGNYIEFSTIREFHKKRREKCGRA